MTISPTPFTYDDYEITNRQVIHEGIFRYVHYYLRHRLLKGGWTPIIKRELLERTSAAGILPYDPVLDQVVLISQFRPGAMISETMAVSPTAKLSSPWVIEIVAGVLDTLEKPAEVAVREAQEEAGCDIQELYPIEDYFVSPGGSNEYFHLYCGRIDAKGLGGIHGLQNEHEDIYAFVLPVEEAFELLRQGKIKTAPAIIALQWLQINHHFLRDFWLKKS
jgi:ADP-ribose pyrophosphatase